MDVPAEACLDGLRDAFGESHRPTGDADGSAGMGRKTQAARIFGMADDAGERRVDPADQYPMPCGGTIKCACEG